MSLNGWHTLQSTIDTIPYAVSADAIETTITRITTFWIPLIDAAIAVVVFLVADFHAKWTHVGVGVVAVIRIVYESGGRGTRCADLSRRPKPVAIGVGVPGKRIDGMVLVRLPITVVVDSIALLCAR